MNIDQTLASHGAWVKGKGGSRANLRGVDLRGADLRGVDLSDADLSDADLRYADLSGADLRRADLRGADLRGVDLSDADLSGVDLSGADLRRADLSDADLSDADLSDADLRYADLRYADLSDADLSGVDLCGAIGDMNHIRSMAIEQYPIVYTADVIQIGCENHSIDDWRGFSDAEILQMDGKVALKFWRKWKEVILQIIEMAPAAPTSVSPDGDKETAA